MKKYLIFYIIIIFLSSCSDWLDVQPKMWQNEEDVFSKEIGFKQALTGLYLKMGQPELYGRELSYGYIDVLAKRYYNTSIKEWTNFKSMYTYPSDYNKPIIEGYWNNMYTTIANANNLLAWIDKKGEEVIQTPKYLNVIKGEAFAIRAFLHFDLLRMFGPIYKNSPDSSSIPYRTVFNRNIIKAESASKVIEYIINDLGEASKLLEDDDMDMTFPVWGVENTDPFLRHRYKRINKFAIKALLARIYMYKGDKTNALKYAKEVINAKDKNNKPIFSLISDNLQDRIFSKEIIFSVSSFDMDKIIPELFSSSQRSYDVSSGSYYNILDKKRFEDMFNVKEDGSNDIRVRQGQGFNMTASGGFCLKYHQNTAFSSGIKNTIPIIRLPEMYYIVAEATSDINEAQMYLSKVVEARGNDQLKKFKDEEDRIKNIEKEYRKEFYAEGQLWYFYKRHEYTEFPFIKDEGKLEEKNYIFPIVENEVILNDIK